jgi:glutamine amidotransferase
MKINCSILDISISNKQNILEACNFVGLDCKFIKSSDEINNSDILIFPGNGNFHEAMNIISTLGIEEAIKNFINLGKPFLGVCLGMQVLFSSSNEGGKMSNGLGILDGEVSQINSEDKNLQIPLVGWLPFNKNKKIIEDKNFLSNFKDNTPMYFNNSCVVNSINEKYNRYYTDYNGLTFCSAISYKNIIATQFHPELSSKNGLRIYEFLKNKIK